MASVLPFTWTRASKSSKLRFRAAPTQRESPWRADRKSESPGRHRLKRLLRMEPLIEPAFWMRAENVRHPCVALRCLHGLRVDR